jgi:hypothetical protein
MEEKHSSNCSNCRFSKHKSTFPRCVTCLDGAKPDNQFPGWIHPGKNAEQEAAAC